MTLSLEWSRLRAWNGTQNRAFELLCNQLAGHEAVPVGSTYVAKAAPDAGVESYWIFPDGSEWGFQAKFFTSSMDPSRWGQIDGSVKTAIAKHAKLVRYTICMPIDRADPRIDKEKWFKNQWDEHVEKWKAWAAEAGCQIEFTYWGETEITDRLALEKHAGRYFFWFNKDLFTTKWFEDQLKRTIENAGPRYTPEINVSLPVSGVFDGLFRQSRFFEELAKLRREIKKYARFSPTGFDAFASAEIASLNKEAGALLGLVDAGLDAKINQPIKFADIVSSSETTREAAITYESRLNAFEKAKREEAKEKGTPPPTELYQQPSMFADSIGNVRRLLNALYGLEAFCEENSARASNSNAILLTGNGGCGKTHLYCDIATQRLRDGAGSVLLLGQHFNSGAPWKQILDLLGLNCQPDEFLSALEIAGELSGHLAMFSIDALNEGDGRTLWRNHLAGLLADVRRFPGIRVCLSVRSTYEDLCIPKNITENNLLRVGHRGFADHEYIASKTFFAFYKIKQPSVPLLVPEFQNPLFLKTFCKGLNNAGRTEIPDGMHGITAVFDFFIQSINEKLAAPEYLDYDPMQQPVQKAVQAIASIMGTDKEAFVERAKAQQAINAFLPTGGYGKTLFFHLLSEGLFTENRMPSHNSADEWIDVVIFAYERFTDHLVAKRMLDHYADVEALQSAFGVDGALHYLAESHNSAYFNRGLLEAFCIQIPERFGKEFPDLVPHAQELDGVRAAFLESIALRNTAAFSAATDHYINSTVLAYQGGWDDFFEVLLTVATNPSHPHNARRLHSNLLSRGLAERDALWTLSMSEKYGQQGAVDRLVDWSTQPDDKGYIEDKSLELCGIVLGWLLTSPNRTLRDRATKGLVNLFTNRLRILQQVLHRFATVDDPYVAERLWCVAYGCALRSRIDGALTALAQFTYVVIFKSGSPPPNILLRDYARGIVERALYEKLPVNVIKKRIRPPYRSDWSDNVPSMKELEEQFGWSQEKDNPVRAAWISIVGSVLHGGDFERYVIGTNSGTFPWSSRRIDEPPLDAEQKRKGGESFSLELARRWIFNRVVELGWTPEKFGDYDRNVNRHQYDRRADKTERIGKKYQWMAYYEFVARVADNFQYSARFWDSSANSYQGPWQVSYARNIDPTSLLTADRGDASLPTWWSPLVYVPTSDMTPEEWVKTIGDVPSPMALIQVRNPSDGSNWLVLETHRNFDEPASPGQERFDLPYRCAWYMVRSYLVKRSDEQRLLEELSNKNLWEQRMPESTDDHRVFIGEFFWSPIYDAHDDSYYGRDGWTKDGLSAKVCVTAEGYLRERVYDCSIFDAIRLLLPAKQLFEGIGLRWGGNESQFLDLDGTIATFDPSAFEAGPSALLIKQAVFQKFLDAKDLTVIWTVLGAKQWMTGSMRDEKWVGELQINGVYSLKNGVLVEDLRSRWKGPES